MIDRSEVFFPSGEDRCHAWLYLPEGATPATPAPVLVMGHGLGAIKEMRLAAFAERFQAEGYACLVFDYRHFGQSTGEPRELLSIPRQREDWRSAVAFARTLPDVDPASVIVWGTSFGGGHAIVTAADDPSIAASIAQCPFTDGFASLTRIPPRAAARLTLAALRDLLAAATGGEPVRVPVAALPGEVALMSADDVSEGVLELLEASGLTEAEYRSEVPARIGLAVPLARPGRRAKDLTKPALFCVCDRDTVAPARATLRHAAKAPKGEVRRYDAGHFDIYLGDDFDQVIADQIAFLRQHVPSRLNGTTNVGDAGGV
ncbi:alpha/beta hydrolase [Nocardioides limicola]|uniref:alpha/beta hydrolase n=1 Tax=Nocardioides limicola TaxID=2803368 RepID=UPI00193B7635|nr:alpha/beta hydrolase [Nocardioides sp. DJM-14]